MSTLKTYRPFGEPFDVLVDPPLATFDDDEREAELDCQAEDFAIEEDDNARERGHRSIYRMAQAVEDAGALAALRRGPG